MVDKPSTTSVTDATKSFKRTSRAWLLILLSVGAIAGGTYTINYFELQQPMNEVLTTDQRNAGLRVNVHYGVYVNPSVLVYDLRSLAGTNSKAEVFRSLLQFAEKMKTKT